MKKHYTISEVKNVSDQKILEQIALNNPNPEVRKIMFDTDKYDTLRIYSIMKSTPSFVYEDEKMESVMNKLESTGAWNLPVLDDENRFLGFVSKSKIFSSYREQLKEVSQD